jgi:heavy metal translocating P-type ATPase
MVPEMTEAAVVSSPAPPARSLRDAVSRALDLGFLPFTIICLALGGALHMAGQPALGDVAWIVPTVASAVRLLVGIVRDLAAGRTGVDIVALLAMVGSVALGELLAGAVIAAMYATGQALETFAQGRAERELSALLARSPAVAHRYRDGGLETVAAGEVRAGDSLLVKPGEAVPVDGIVREGIASLDESAVTGESRVVVREPSDPVASGVINAGGPFDLLATATADASTYAGIVRLVREAQASRAPFVRLADRYALWFLAFSLGLAGVSWLLTGDPVRALAVLVVATPCPLLLAAPIAIVAGISRCARRGIIVKGGGALEALANTRTLLLDKTGTLTTGRPRVERVAIPPGGDPDEVLALAASLEQVSPHVLATAIVHAARDRGLRLEMPLDMREEHGAGVRGRVRGRDIAVGNRDWMTSGSSFPRWAREVRRQITVEGSTAVYVEADGALLGIVVLEDPIRAETPRALRLFRQAGIRRVVMVTGDHPAVADPVGAALGVDGVLAERAPGEKVEAVHAERLLAPGGTAMIGDGINDAPALAAADVGIAMGARGATASSEAADVVITVDRLDRLGEGIAIARRARSIAVQSVLVGMGLSVVAMVVAALGFLEPVAGAILQELIDVIVILNALRALAGGTARVPSLAGWGATRARLEAEHAELRPLIARVQRAGDVLDGLPPTEVRRHLEQLADELEGRLLGHEQEEETIVYPTLARVMGEADPMAVLSGSHREIFHLIRLLRRMTGALPDDGADADDLRDIRRVLYGLHAILDLHMDQEEEIYDTVHDPTASGRSTVAAGARGAHA